MCSSAIGISWFLLLLRPPGDQSCLVTGLTGGLCSPTDTECMCTSEAFQANVTGCVSISCTIPQSLTTKNVTETTCGAPVRDRSRKLVRIVDGLTILAGIFVLVRLVCKVVVSKVHLMLDDWLILATLLTGIASVCTIIYGAVANGLGRDIWTLTSQHITSVFKYFYIMTILYFFQTTLVKLSIISFYMRIFPTPQTRRILWATFTFTSLWGLAFVLAAIFSCWPIAVFWKKWDGMHPGTCINTNAMAWANASTNISLDVWILAVPMWELRRLQLHWKKKIGVGFMFSLGAFVTVVSILRLRSLIYFSKTDNPTWQFYDVSLWSDVEVSVAVICACLPAVRLLLVKMFPVLGGTSNRHAAYYQKDYHSGHRGGPSVGGGSIAGASHSVHVSAGGGGGDARSQPGSNAADEGASIDSNSGIIFHNKTYQVQVTDSDEVSLVNLARGKGPGTAL
ncbi:CFEM domain [Geosmithia morbida]|uniref:CFEM domain n=1 Tax=Geosmithia morbida TaxID=1094350 RepID=A0A9P5D151_9HYPO|nr:CFEM domain [Geosmithia morbida]KAF4119510.1 CFEM domain [Geosmithia morbida]